MPFTPITDAKMVPKNGARSEAPWLDFKARVDPVPSFEKAKDIAALANASGGVVLIGVKHDETIHLLRCMTRRHRGCRVVDVKGLAVESGRGGGKGA